MPVLETPTTLLHFNSSLKYMAIKIPKSIKIGNRTIAVSQEVIDGNVFGFYDPMGMRIVMQKDLQPQALVETFWHELMHAIFDFIRFGFEMQTEMSDKDTPEVDAFKIEERTAENFAKTFLQVMQDNDLANITA